MWLGSQSDEMRGWVDLCAIYSESWAQAQAEPGSKIKVSLERWDLSQGT
jgi:hypothetical protein